MAHDSKKDGNGGAEERNGKLSHELMLEWAQTGLMAVEEQVANGCTVKQYVVLPVSTRISSAKACAPYYAPEIIGQKRPGRREQAAAMKASGGSSKAPTGKRPHELMLEWAQSGLMEVPQQLANGCFVKKYVVLSVPRRINLAKACVRYYARKLVGQEQPSSERQPAETKHKKDGDGAAKSHTGKRPHELMWEWGGTGVMEVPERVKKGYFVKKFSALSFSRRFNLAVACAPYFSAKIT
jgi:hypothetical protein